MASRGADRKRCSFLHGPTKRKIKVTLNFSNARLVRLNRSTVVINFESPNNIIPGLDIKCSRASMAISQSQPITTFTNQDMETVNYRNETHRLRYPNVVYALINIYT